MIYMNIALNIVYCSMFMYIEHIALKLPVVNRFGSVCVLQGGYGLLNTSGTTFIFFTIYGLVRETAKKRGGG